MADFEFDIPDDFLKDLDIFENEEVVDEMINSSLVIYQKAIQRALAKHKQSGELIKSVKIKKAKQAKTGARIGNVVFSGKDSAGSPNVVKAMALQYGNRHQPARPFMQAAIASCENEIISNMQNIYNKEVGGT